MQINLKAKVSVETEVELNIETPVFFKEAFSSNVTSYLGVIEESTIRIFVYNKVRTCLQNDATEDMVREIKTAYDKWEHISEEEFMEALNKALKDFDFKATMRLIHETV